MTQVCDYHLESKISRIVIVKELTEHGAKVNTANNDGNIPLMLAAESGHTEIVAVLERASEFAKSTRFRKPNTQFDRTKNLLQRLKTLNFHSRSL